MAVNISNYTNAAQILAQTQKCYKRTVLAGNAPRTLAQFQLVVLDVDQKHAMVDNSLELTEDVKNASHTPFPINIVEIV